MVPEREPLADYKTQTIFLYFTRFLVIIETNCIKNRVAQVSVLHNKEFIFEIKLYLLIKLYILKDFLS